jgi:hypothetical protein
LEAERKAVSFQKTLGCSDTCSSVLVERGERAESQGRSRKERKREGGVT